MINFYGPEYIDHIGLFLLFGHFLADYPLQGDFLAKAKDPYNPIPGVPWYQAMFAHCFIQAVFVLLFTGMYSLFIFEFMVHWITDMSKCKKMISYNVDQGIHIGCKVLYTLIFLFLSSELYK